MGTRVASSETKCFFFYSVLITFHFESTNAKKKRRLTEMDNKVVVIFFVPKCASISIDTDAHRLKRSSVLAVQ